jgi:Fe(3+) dicitrate transport protein
MINYVLKSPDTTRRFSFEAMQSIGSYGLFSTYAGIGGKIGKLTYYGYYHKRVSDGYRKNSASDGQGQFIGLSYEINPKLTLRAEIGRSQYKYQLPGPLTDSMFHADPRQSTRSRNFYSPDIYVPSITLHWSAGKNTQLEWTTSGVFGDRSSVEFEGFADKVDAIDPVSLAYKPRVVNIDLFNSKTTEVRLIHSYHISSLKNVIGASLTYFNNDMRRRQQAKGTTGSDYDLTIVGDWGRDLLYASQSVSFAIENLIYLTPALTLSPGFRYETGETRMTGHISYLDPADIPNVIKHSIPVFGINAQYRFGEQRLYGGISQAYRPVLFKDIIPGSTLERANKDLEDAFGYNAELGFNGRFSDWLKYDVTLFRVLYQNKLGNLLLSENGADYIYKTNIGDSQTNGVELFVEGFPVRTRTLLVSVFTSTSLMKATYINAVIASGNENRDISGNEVESVPRIITRNGLNVAWKTARMSLLYSYVAKSFSDPLNVEIPTSNGARGVVPAYGLLDLNFSLRLPPHFLVRAGVNNLFNSQYFTKRPLFYPGPGVWPSDGRTFVFSFTVKL